MVLTKKAYLIRDDEMVEIDKDDFIIGRANHLRRTAKNSRLLPR